MTRAQMIDEAVRRAPCTRYGLERVLDQRDGFDRWFAYFAVKEIRAEFCRIAQDQAIG